MVRIWRFHCRGWGSIPGRGTKIPQAVQHSQEKKKKEKNWCTKVKLRGKELPVILISFSWLPPFLFPNVLVVPTAVLPMKPPDRAGGCLVSSPGIMESLSPLQEERREYSSC